MSHEENMELHNTSIEAAVLSAIIFDNEIINDLSDKLSPRDFYLPGHRAMYKAMLELSEKGQPLDEVFLLEKISATEKYAQDIILSVMSATPISNITAYIDGLKRMSQKRMLLDVSLNIRKGLSDGVEAEKILINAMDMLDETQNITSVAQNDRKMSEITAEIRGDMEKARTGEKMPFYATGYPQFDSEIGGFVENGLTVVAGRPSMGKSSFISGPIVKTLNNGDSAVLYSMEVADKNALIRLVSFKSQEPLSSIKKGMVSGFDKFNEAMSFFEANDENFSIVDRSGMNKKELELDIIRRLKNDNKLKLIVVDHLLQIQLTSGGHAPTELGEITKMLKRISQNYKVTVVLLSQLNRSVESRDNKRPMMADLQGSGSIEQDADMIVFLYRREYYREKEWDQEKDGAYEKKQIEQAEVIIGKNRDGPTGSVELNFRAATASFLVDYMPISNTEYTYIDDGEFEASNNTQNNDHEASVKDNDDIIDVDIDRYTNVSMPLI